MVVVSTKFHELISLLTYTFVKQDLWYYPWFLALAVAAADRIETFVLTEVLP